MHKLVGDMILPKLPNFRCSRNAIWDRTCINCARKLSCRTRGDELPNIDCIWSKCRHQWESIKLLSVKFKSRLHFCCKNKNGLLQFYITALSFAILKMHVFLTWIEKNPIYFILIDDALFFIIFFLTIVQERSVRRNMVLTRENKTCINCGCQTCRSELVVIY